VSREFRLRYGDLAVLAAVMLIFGMLGGLGAHVAIQKYQIGKSYDWMACHPIDEFAGQDPGEWSK